MAAADLPGDAIEAVLLAGPTASGKSALAIELAGLYGGSIINTDSMQVYRDLEVITARPTHADLEACPHLLYGHVDAAQNHSVGRWMSEAAEALAAVRRIGRLPILVGGTGLYFKAAERGLAEVPPVPEAIRTRVRSEADGVPPAILHERLARLDPASAARLRPSDPQRIIRALEVFEATGRSLSSWQGEAHTAPILNPERCIRLFLAPERAALFERIDRRFDGMIAAGALEEIEALAKRGLDPALPAMRAHGVPWLAKALRGEIGMPVAITHAKADTRHYAKRQFTWFRHQMPGWRFVPPQDGLAAVRSLLSR